MYRHFATAASIDPETEHPVAPKSTRLYLDRIEGDFGVVLAPDGSAMDLPLTMLPDGVRAGAAMVLTLDVDEAETQEARARVALMMEDLLKGNVE
jgi:hypothetical protein